MANRLHAGRIRHILKPDEKTMTGWRTGIRAISIFLPLLGCLGAFLVRPVSDSLAEQPKEAAPVASDNSKRGGEKDVRNSAEPAPTEKAPTGTTEAEAAYAEMVEQYNELLKQKRIDEALETAKLARLLQPENPLSELMVLKARYGQQVASTEEKRQLAVALADRRALAIYRALQKRIWMDFKDAPLSEIVKQLASRCEINVVVDTLGLEDEGVTTNARVSAAAQGARASTFLDQILSPLHLDYIVKDDVLRITSRLKARGDLLTVNYSVADLLPMESFNGTMLVDAKPLEDLIETICEKIAPDSWEKASGPGAITPYRTTASLVIRQTSDVHEEISRFLKTLGGD